MIAGLSFRNAKRSKSMLFPPTNNEFARYFETLINGFKITKNHGWRVSFPPHVCVRDDILSGGGRTPEWGDPHPTDVWLVP